MIAVCCFFVGCGSSSNNLSPLEQEEGYYWYEAIFLQKDDVEEAFRTASDHFPNYEYVPDDFHVTTQFKPDPKHESLYGTAVTVLSPVIPQERYRLRRETLFLRTRAFLLKYHHHTKT